MATLLPLSGDNGAKPKTLDDKLKQMNARALAETEKETRELIGDDAFSKVNGFLAQYGC